VTVAAPATRRRGLYAGVLALLLVAAAAGHLWYGLRNHFFDLSIYRDAMVWWRDHPLYDFARPDATQGSLEFTYPPFAALLMAPLGWVSWPLAAVGYVLASVAALGAAIWWLVQPLADRHSVPRWFAFGTAFLLATGLEPIRESFSFGQINFVLWALILFDLLVLLPRGSRFVGVGIGLATAIKLVPGIFIVYLLVARRWRAATVAAATTVAATGLAFAIAPHDSWVYFSQKLVHAEGVGQLHYTFNQSLLGVLAKLAFPEQPSRLLWLVLTLPVLGYGLWRAGQAAKAGDEVAGLALTGFVGSLLSPVTWHHHIFWFAPALVVLVDRALPGAGGEPDPPGWPAVWGGIRSRTGALTLAIFTYVTATYSVMTLWAFTLDEPGGVTGLIMSNWLVWVMLLLLPLLPIRRLSATAARRQVAV
jgi:alpha-1,2-mannosyltransferase